MMKIYPVFFISPSTLIYGRNSLYTGDPYVGKTVTLPDAEAPKGSPFFRPKRYKNPYI